MAPWCLTTGTPVYPLLPPAEAYFQERFCLNAKFFCWKNVSCNLCMARASHEMAATLYCQGWGFGSVTHISHSRFAMPLSPYRWSPQAWRASRKTWPILWLLKEKCPQRGALQEDVWAQLSSLQTGRWSRTHSRLCVLPLILSPKCVLGLSHPKLICSILSSDVISIWWMKTSKISEGTRGNNKTAPDISPLTKGKHGCCVMTWTKSSKCSEICISRSFLLRMQTLSCWEEEKMFCSLCLGTLATSGPVSFAMQSLF